MKIVLTGGTGFLGRALATTLADDGHEVIVLTRGTGAPPSRAHSVQWTPNGDTGPWARHLDGAAAVVNLAGESIAAHRWTAPHKQRVLDSRVNATRSIVSAIHAAANPPAVLVNGSAVGYYGPRADEIVTEETPAGSDFLAEVCVQWEAEAMRAASARTRVACVRTGLPLGRDGGALPALLPPFWFGVGGPIGSGRQYWPWIHRADWVALVRWVIQTPAVTGPVNATGPAPVTNAEFARALGRAMHRPAFVPAPAFAMRILLGEMATALVLAGQRAVPAKAERLGFGFRYRTVQDALTPLFR